MSDLGHDVSTVVTGMASDLSRETAKMANESVKQMLIYLINKTRELGDRPGEKSLKKLLQNSSNDEIKLFDLEQKHLKEFSDKAKKYHVPYAVIEDQGRHSVFYRGSDETRIKAIIESLLEKQLTSDNNENKKIVPVQVEVNKSKYDFEIVGDHSIKVKQAILDLDKPVERALATQEGVRVEEILKPPKEMPKELDERKIRIENAVLDLDKPVQRTLAQEEGVDVRSFFEHLRNLDSAEPVKEADNDERYNKAVQLAKEQAEIAVPKLQSELNVGYSEARALIDRMEAEGLVTTYDGSKPQQYIGDRPKEPAHVHQASSEQSKDESQSRNIDNPKPQQTVSYEHLGGTKIRVPSVTLDLQKAEHRELAESYGIKVAEIDFKRETSDLRIEKAEIRGKESLGERLEALPAKEQNDHRSDIQRFFRAVEGRLSLEERRDQIRPIMAAAKEAAPTKNKTKERGGR